MTLAEQAERFCDGDGAHTTAIAPLFLYRASQPTVPSHGLHEPALCIVARGRKVVTLGDRTYQYDPDHYLLVSVDLPVSGCVVETPYLGIRLDLAPDLIADVMLSAGMTAGDPGVGLGVSPLEGSLKEALHRLIGLLETPSSIPILSPLIMREIVYHLLCGPQSAQLQRLAAPDGRRGIMQAIHWLKNHYMEPLRIENLARDLNMSASGLHHQFKAVTTMSPLQYQKQLRLQEARRLLLAAAGDAASVSFQVGYNSPSQFSREYSRLFGAPPQKDIARLRG